MLGVGVASIVPTMGGGAACALATGGACALPTGAALLVEGGMVVAGSAAVAYGAGVIAFAKNNPVQGNTPKWNVGDPINSPKAMVIHLG